MPEDLLIFGALMPGVIAGVVLLAARKGGRAAFGGALAVTLGFLTSWSARTGWTWPEFPPGTSAKWIPYLTLLAAAVAAFEAKTRWLRWLARPAVCGLAVYLILRRTITNQEWDFNEAAMHAGVLAAIVWILWGAMDGLAQRRSGISVPLVLMIVFAGAVPALVKAHAAAFAERSGALAACMGAGAAVALIFFKQETRLRSAVGPAVLAGCCLLFCANLYADLPLAATYLLAGAPLLAWLGEIKWVTSRPAWQAILIRILLVALPVAAAYFVTADAIPDNPYGYG